MDYSQKSLDLHSKLHGKIEIHSKKSVRSDHDLATLYTPGIAAVSRAVFDSPELVYDLTIKRNSVAVVTDGSAVLGLGNIGPLAALPVMEGKAMLLKEFANIDAWPICIDSQDSETIINVVRNIAPGFGGILLEDISAPRCFEIEAALQNLDIPVFHDDQHGTAIVVRAAIINAARVLNVPISSLKVLINGAGAAGLATASLLYDDVNDLIICDSEGAIYKGRRGLNPEKKRLSLVTNKAARKGSLAEVIDGIDVFIGVSKGNLLSGKDVKRMGKQPVILALANPVPEIAPSEALEAGAVIVATGRSDYANQVNNVLAFPGIFKGALTARIGTISKEMKIAAASALAKHIARPKATQILPSPLDKTVVDSVASSIVLN